MIVDSDAGVIGRALRERLDRDERAAAFVGDFDADREALDEFVRDVVRAGS